MSDPVIPVDSLVLYKTRPALIKEAGSKLEVRLEDGRTLRVRPKDVELLHPGPIRDFADLDPPRGEVKAAWELLSGETTTLAELAELAYGEFEPATAWAAWELVADGLYFQGSPQAIVARTPEEVAAEQARREARAREAQARHAFLQRARMGHFAPEDHAYLQELADVALGQRQRSKLLDDLGRAQSAESAHGLLLELGYWDAFVDPYPARLNVPLQPAQIPLPGLPDEDRVDLTWLSSFAIDDEDSTDPDDAISLEGDRLWVHVADVAALVAPDSPADLEARNRGANLYLPEGTVTMLPAAATEQLALGLQDISPALSFGLRIDSSGEIGAIDIMPSWVRVTRMTYDEAEEALDQPPLAELASLAGILESRRRRSGAITIDLPEVKIRVEDGRVELRPLFPLRSRSVVSEAMLAAGEATARFAQARDIALPYAVQDPPLIEDWPDGMAGMFAQRKSLKPSQQSTVPRPHAGLGLASYTRVTSPLRRYLDLVAHQQLRAYLRGEPLLDSGSILARVGAAEAVTDNLRRCERLARQHWTLVYLLQHPGWQGEGILVEQTAQRGTILLPQLAWEARVHLRSAPALNSRIPVILSEVNLPALEAFFQLGAGH